MFADTHVTIKWSEKNKKALVEYGFKFTKYSDEVRIPIEDAYKVKINGFKGRTRFMCDICGANYSGVLNDYDPDQFHLCKDCKPKDKEEQISYVFECIVSGGSKMKLISRGKDEEEAKKRLVKNYVIDKILRHHEIKGRVS